jgi:imidazolonepropionase
LPPLGRLIIDNIHQLVTSEPDLFDASDEGGRSIGLIENACMVVDGGLIEWAGRQSDFDRSAYPGAEHMDAAGGVVLPGLIDAHTHAVFAGTREREYEMRVSGAAYMDIARQGGGINATVNAVRAASVEDLAREGLRRLDTMIKRGTTTVEIKSGYGLSLDHELKMLEAIRRVRDEAQAEVVPTFLGAHEFPPEYRDDRERYLDIVCEEMIPAVGESGLAEFCDVFCEKGVFTADQSRRILRSGKERGLKPKIHADEFADSGGALVAAEVGAVSAGHLGFASREGLEAMREAGTVAVLLPGVSVGLGKLDFADARSMLDIGLDVAVATDFNPGSSMADSLTVISSLACSFLKMTPAEVLLGMTIKAARALSRDGRIGSIKAGKQADLVLFSIPDFRYIPYHFGGDMVRAVVKQGNVLFDRGAQETS